MPYHKDHKQKSRERILRSAMKLFTRQGFEETSIDEVMADAGLTRGGFYAHFASKQALYAQAIANTSALSLFAESKPERMSDQAWLYHIVGNYLHRKHITDAEFPCPLAFLATDVSLREPETRQAYSDAYLKMNQAIQDWSDSSSACDKDTVLAVTAMMIGGVAVARNMQGGATRNRLLKSCRELAVELLGAAQ